MQRPPWVRQIERRLGWVMREGSYGLMQVRSRKPLSDIESVDLALSTLLRGARIDTIDDPDTDPFVLALKGYSTDSEYAGQIYEIYHLLESDSAKLNRAFSRP
jgi:hypothetical protein